MESRTRCVIFFSVLIAIAVLAAARVGIATEILESPYPSPDEFVKVDISPEAVSVPDPSYPEEALKNHVEGDVWIRVLVNSAGEIGGVITDRESGKNTGFELSAMKAALDGKWKPAVTGGKPVACWVSYKVSFKLH